MNDHYMQHMGNLMIKTNIYIKQSTYDATSMSSDHFSMEVDVVLCKKYIFFPLITSCI